MHLSALERIGGGHSADNDTPVSPTCQWAESELEGARHRYDSDILLLYLHRRVQNRSFVSNVTGPDQVQHWTVFPAGMQLPVLIHSGLVKDS
jgi:hypothetical protein